MVKCYGRGIGVGSVRPKCDCVAESSDNSMFLQGHCLEFSTSFASSLVASRTSLQPHFGTGY